MSRSVVPNPIPYIMGQLTNPIFMAGLAGGDNALGGCLGAVKTSLSVPPEYFEKFAELIIPVKDSFDRLSFEGDIIRIATGGKTPRDVALAQRAIAKTARPFLQPRVLQLARDISEKRTGVPVGRPKGQELVHKGFEAGTLRFLADAGVLDRETVSALCSALVSNIHNNTERLSDMNNPFYTLHTFWDNVMFAGGMAMTAPVVRHYLDLPLWLDIAAWAVTALGSFSLYFGACAFKRSRPVVRSLDLPVFARQRLCELISEQEELAQTYEAALGNYPAFLDEKYD